MRYVLLAAALACLATPASHAANVNNPYGNINPANDAGNDTGDSEVEALNQSQLDSNGIARPRHVARPRYARPRNPFAYVPDRTQTYPTTPYQTQPYPPRYYASPNTYNYGYPPPQPPND